MSVIVSNLSHYYQSQCALDQVSFELHPGLNILLGPNGAGKSTLFALLTGLTRHQQGDITYFGQSLQQNRRSIMAQIGVVFQQSTLDLDLTVRQNLQYFAALHGLNGTESIARLSDMLERLELDNKLDHSIRQLNGGHRRRVELARSLITQPRIMLYDEPTVGLDIHSRQLILDFVSEQAQQTNGIFLWATHLLEEVSIDSSLILLNRGNIAGTGTCRSLLANYEVETVNQLFQAFTSTRKNNN